MHDVMQYGHNTWSFVIHICGMRYRTRFTCHTTRSRNHRSWSRIIEHGIWTMEHVMGTRDSGVWFMTLVERWEHHTKLYKTNCRERQCIRACGIAHNTLSDQYSQIVCASLSTCVRTCTQCMTIFLASLQSAKIRAEIQHCREQTDNTVLYAAFYTVNMHSVRQCTRVRRQACKLGRG